ncbi:MAG: EAL domain-containing protein [Nitrospirae bacterium]|nr:EAL domain-containing protein [Nitrospirota bacterium]
MRLKTLKNKMSISSKFILLTGSLILLTSSVVAIFMIRAEAWHSYRELAEKGNSLALIMAENADYGIYTENLENLKAVAESLENDSDIIYVRIYNADKKVLVYSSKKTSLLRPRPGDRVFPFPVNMRQPVTTHFDNFIDIIAPVTSVQGRFTDTLFPGEVQPGRRKIIGYLEIGLTLEWVSAKVNSFIVSAVISTFLCVLLGIALAILLSKRITSPLGKLNLATREIAAGRFDHLVDIRTGDEISDLAGAFNHMLGRLKDFRSQVEARTNELSMSNQKLIEEIRSRTETEISLAATKIRLQHLLTNTPAVIYSCKPCREFEVAFISENIKSLIGFCNHEFLKDPQKWALCVHRDDAWRFMKERERVFSAGHNSIEYRFMHKDGQFIWIYDELKLIRNADGVPVEVVGYMIDVTKRRTLEDQLIKDALHDPLTGLPNRALFLDRLEKAIATAKRLKDCVFCVLFLDLDRFKKVNDGLGHVTGDKLLIAAAGRLSNCIHENDTVARLSGDEFAIILADMKGYYGAENISARIHKELTTPFNIDGQEIYLSVSIGIVMNDKKYERAEQFLRDADTAMYHAKGRGGGCHVLFDTHMHELALRSLRLETGLRHAVERGELFLEYQPIVSANTGRVKGFEALLRWSHPEHGLLLPKDFIHVAEVTGLIVPIGNWVIHEACRQMKIWHNEFPSYFPLAISINISSRQFTPQLIQYIKRVLGETGFDPGSLILEITESVIMEDPEATARILMTLKGMDVRLQIDDFGMGYSSLNYLHHFPVDALKIDQSFIRRMNDNEDRMEIVKLIITLAHNLYMNVIAEGVETVAQHNLLRDMECEYVQGFLFSSALGVKEAGDFLQRDHIAR